MVSQKVEIHTAGRTAGTKDMMRTAVVILNWNGRSHLERFLGSVTAHTAAPTRIIVADNGSTDSSSSSRSVTRRWSVCNSTATTAMPAATTVL